MIMVDFERLVAFIGKLDTKTAAKGGGLTRKDGDLPRSDGGLSI
jgi:hypothetical protein